jgi:hypothetical protein
MVSPGCFHPRRRGSPHCDSEGLPENEFFTEKIWGVPQGLQRVTGPPRRVPIKIRQATVCTMMSLLRPATVISTIVALPLLMMVLAAGCTGSSPAASGPAPGPAAAGPDINLSWKAFPLTDLQGKGNFSVNQFTGKPVLVPVLSEDCPTCIVLQSRQLAEIGRLPGVQEGKIMVVALDLDPAGSAGFIEKHHTEFTFTGFTARSPDDLTLDLLHTFGPFAVDTDAVPVILVCPDGHDLLLPAGVKTAEALNASLVKEC